LNKYPESVVFEFSVKVSPGLVWQRIQ